MDSLNNRNNPSVDPRLLYRSSSVYPQLPHWRDRSIQDVTLNNAASFKAKSVFVYSGPGAWGVEGLCTALRKPLTGYSVKTITPEEVIAGDWKKDAALFVMPGGADCQYVAKLNGAGNAHIKNFVHDGGSYLGVCGGAYYAGRVVSFSIDTPLEVVGVRELAFFPSVISGPTLKPFVYNSEQGSAAAKITWGFNTKTHVYYNGGGAFENADSSGNTLVVGRYADLPDTPAAIVTCSHGNGRAVLSSVHPEISAEALEEANPYSKEILPTLKKDNNEREELFKYLLKLSGLEVI